MTNILDSFFYILAHHAMLYVSSLLFCWFCFQTLIKLTLKIKHYSNLTIAVFSFINAGFASFSEIITPGPVYPLIMAIIPAIIVAEIALLTEDTLWGYVNYYFLTLLDLVCIHGLSSSLITLVLRNPWPVGGAQHRYALFTICMLISAFLFWVIPHSKAMSMHELSQLMHSKKRGTVLLVYIIVASTGLLIASIFSLTIVYDESLSLYTQQMFHADLAIKDGVLLVCSFFIITFKVHQEKSFHRIQTIEQDIRKEREFRASRQYDSILSYCANITQNRIIEGWENFSGKENDSGSDYNEAIKNFVENCVHPEDVSKLNMTNDTSYYEDIIENKPSFVIQIRLSPAHMLDDPNFPPSVKSKLTDIDKEWIWCAFNITIIREENSGDILAYVSLTDIDNEATEKEILRKAANTDHLTGLYNRSALEEYMQQYMSREDSCGALFIIDMDYFKSINDSLGHPTGDLVIQETGRLLTNAFRKDDFIVRLGGDEFCIFAPGLISEFIIKRKAASLNNAGMRTYASADETIHIKTSLSIGISILSPENRVDYETLYKQADTALYEAKNAGRNTYRFFNTPPRKKIEGNDKKVKALG